MINTVITPIEVDGQFWITIQLDGHETQQRGPFASADEAEATARQIAGICRVLFHSGEIRHRRYR
jgi:hypothetical protein